MRLMAPSVMDAASAEQAGEAPRRRPLSWSRRTNERAKIGETQQAGEWSQEVRGGGVLGNRK